MNQIDEKSFILGRKVKSSYTCRLPPFPNPEELSFMVKKIGVVLAAVALVLCLSSRYAARVFGASSRQVLITQPIDESQLVRLARNTRPEANAKNDRGSEPDGFLMDHMLLQLKRDPQVEQEFAQYIETLTDKTSPNFRHWMMADEQGEKFGLNSQDIDTITSWLQSHGFNVGYVYPNRMVIDFSGTAGQVREAFHTEIHELDVNGQRHFSNMSDPKIPAALAPAIEGVVSMNDFRPHTNVERRKPGRFGPQYTFSGCNGDCLDLVPGDLQTIYNVTPLYKAGITGKGMTVAVIEDTNSYGTDWATYQKKFALGGYGGTLTTLHPDDAKNCTNPGTNGDDFEADIDVEMVTAIAPAAHVELVSCTDTTTFGGLLALENLVSAGSPPPVISSSYAECEVLSGAATNAAFNSAFQTAAAAGISVFVASGDYGSSYCARDFTNGTEVAYPGIGVLGWGETVYNVAVGGTDFEDVYNANEGGKPLSTYWNTTNTSTFASAKSYIPEIPWNQSCASFLLYTIEGYTAPYGTGGFCNSTTGEDFVSTVAGSGGPSNCAKGAGNTTYLYVEDTSCTGYAKPAWQAGILGNPADAVRDVPDVSLFASAGEPWSHALIFCYSDTTYGGTSCAGAPETWVQGGGTSAAAPMMAAIQALVDEKWSIRAGNPNPTYYSIAKTEFGTAGNSTCYSINQTTAASNCTFYDVTQGDNNTDCVYNGTTFLADCHATSTTVGSLGTQPIGSLTLKTAGSGYTSTPTCTIAAPANKSKYLSPKGATIYAGGTQATCTVTINTTTHVVSAVKLTVAGGGYTGVPVCTISGGGGTGATCLAVIKPTTGAPGYQPSFGATPGWDMATGIGTVNAYNLVENKAW
jgi:subtilase family serine protease